MTQPLTDQRARTTLIAELYDRHATGLFAYCADQLGDPGAAGYTLVAVLSSVPAQPPPRAALYAFARREIQRRDVVYSPPLVDPLTDPASALVERALRELRPHQREVLLLVEVCGLTRAELAWVLEVAQDTAEELAMSAAHCFRRSLSTALASVGSRLPAPVADVCGALAVAPLRDILCRLPWPAPPASLRVHVAGSRTATAAPLFVKPLWPAPPRWPQPLADTDPRTATGIFPTDLLTPPSGRAPHDATTAPMPRLRDGALPTFPAFPPPGPASSVASEGADFSVGEEGLPPRPRVRDGLPPRSGSMLSAPTPADVLDDPPTDVLPPLDLPAPGDVLVHSSRQDQPPASGPGAARPGQDEPFSAFLPYTRPPRKPADEPVYRLPMPADILAAGDPDLDPAEPDHPDPDTWDAGAAYHELTRPASAPVQPSAPGHAHPAPGLPASAPGRFPSATGLTGAAPETPAEDALKAPAKRTPAGSRQTARATKKRPRKRKQRKPRDWVWELAGFVICVLIAMLVFFAVPGIGSP
ncbi:sigma-70 family RNA polymerase sigma factor [Nonomuraea typhae]|uniref:sigma-70 family RNA polymerase sigma factor n=1 Tax=Nonomuraea typhae TaxID=2603600 RepID=UPI0012FB5E93|nr:sigma-70 family RNA polymerase sigma factor [Nonomuraea typhae]